jgi:hypothetical protein
VTKIYLILLLVAANLPYITFEVVFRKNARADQLYIVADKAAPSSELVDPNRRRGCHSRVTAHPSIYFGMGSGRCRLSSRHLLTFAENPNRGLLGSQPRAHYNEQINCLVARITLQPSLWQSCPLFDFRYTQHRASNEVGFGPPGPLSEFELPYCFARGF